MAIANLTTRSTGAQGASAEPEKFGVPGVSSILRKLWLNAEDRLTPEALEWIANGATETAGLMAQDFHKIAMGVGCLVAADERVGSFQDEDLPLLLWGFAHTFDTIHGLIEVSKQAQGVREWPAELKMPNRRRAKGGAE